MYNLHLPSIENIINNLKVNDYIEIFLLSILTYYLVTKLYKTRVWVLVKGIFVFFIIYIISKICSFGAISFLFEKSILFLIIAIIMMFQPELRKLLESLGNKQVLFGIKKIFSKNKEEKKITDKTINEIIAAVEVMAKAKTGALIVFEDKIPLNEYIKSGIR